MKANYGKTAAPSGDHLDTELMRVRVILLAMVAALVFLGASLWRVQVVHTSRYRSSLDRQSMRRVRLPGARGLILDRNGVHLAENRPSYCIAVYVEELRQRGRSSNTVNKVEDVLDGLSGVLGLERQVTYGDIVNHMARSCPMPLLAWKDIDEVALARWAESKMTFPGVDVYVEPERSYPQGSLASHVLGHVSRLDPDARDPYHFYLPDMEGREGIERALNVRLAGVAGGLLIRVDALGFRHDQDSERDPIAGEDVVLTLDAGIQRCLEDALAGVKGAGVVLDPRNGDVLAMASAPAFDVQSMRSFAGMKELLSDPNKPLINRAVRGLYAPGSTFKPLVALAALESHRATAQTLFNCPGYFDMGGGRELDCFHRTVHGTLAMQKSIEQSCNVYFCHLGLQCGYEAIVEMARRTGLGRASGVEIVEAAGLVPDNAWKRRTHKDSWRNGDTCNLSIGQGALLVTPLQMAVVCATLANGGFVYRPRLVLRGAAAAAGGDAAHEAPAREGELVANMHWSPRSLAVVRGGMHDVVQAERGTGKRARIEGVEMAGKTGSAETGAKSERRINAWMLVFAPYERPRYAVAMVVEDGESGGATAAPRIKQLMEGILALEHEGHRPRAGG